MPNTTHSLVATSLLFVAAACQPGAETDDTDTAAGTTGTTGATEGPTFWRDVAPIYFERCVTCHQEGGIAPFRLDDYADASAWAEPSAAAVAARTMPPWLATSDGSCGEFRGSRALGDAEIAVIEAWAGAGAPEGEPRTDLVPAAPPTLAAGLDLSTPDFVPEIVGGPLAEFDEYRCFLVDPGFDRDVFLTGYDVLPGNPALVHHVLAMPVSPGLDSGDGRSNLEAMQALDAESPDRAGWPCFSAAGEGVNVESMPVTWAPGMGAVEYTPGTGVRLLKDDLVVIQLHYNLHDAALLGQSDRTTVRLQIADSVEREGFFLLPDLFIETLFDGEPAALAPGEPSVKYTWEYDLGADLTQSLGLDEVEVHGIFPHMHEYGRKWRAELVDDNAAPRCIGDVQRWDFAWQLYYFYQEPVKIGAGSRLRVTCDFDTRSAKEPITPGWGTQNEMCLAGLYVVP